MIELKPMNNYNNSMKYKKVVVNDLMQTQYIYFLTQPIGKNFDPVFKPELSPSRMLKMGIFGGKYMTDCTEEFPKEWFNGVKLCHVRHNPELNFFKINASQPLSVWKAKGWIHPDDPRGWFQWYCRYFMGRRHEDDQRQIRRWSAIKRHIAQIRKNCLPNDLNCRRKQRQAILHWSYDSRNY